MEQAIKCRKCGGKPHVVCVDDCYYARCDKCTKWNPFEFLGLTPNAAIRNWNEGNTLNNLRKRKEDDYDR